MASPFSPGGGGCGDPVTGVIATASNRAGMSRAGRTRLPNICGWRWDASAAHLRADVPVRASSHQLDDASSSRPGTSRPSNRVPDSRWRRAAGSTASRPAGVLAGALREPRGSGCGESRAGPPSRVLRGRPGDLSRAWRACGTRPYRLPVEAAAGLLPGLLQLPGPTSAGRRQLLANTAKRPPCSGTRPAVPSHAINLVRRRWSSAILAAWKRSRSSSPIASARPCASATCS